jgi:PTH1 family peptidyl-tRNA hydrolase
VKLIAGLGNPGPRYVGSRHNVGYMVVDELARRGGVDVSRHDRRFDGLFGDGPLADERVLLLKPTTFMNLSGRSVAAAQRYYKLAPEDVLVIHDDLDLPLGKLRVRASGSAGGHRGMEDVLRHFGVDGVPRLRIGIGRVHPSVTVDYVLSAFRSDEREVVETAVAQAADAAECWVRCGVDKTMNEYNRRDDQAQRGPAGSEGKGDSA